MTTCNECRDGLVDYHFGEAEGEAATAIAQHLSSCAACALEYCRLHAELNGIATRMEVSPPARVLDALQAEVRKNAPRRSWRDLLQLRVPLYQPLALGFALVFVWAVLARPAPAPAEARAITDAPTTIDDYDAPTVLAIDPNLL